MERNNLHNLGAVLKTARKSRGLTREQVAESISITPRYLMSIENEGKKPSLDVLYRIVRELGIPTDTIFYPDSKSQAANTEMEQLIRLLYLCNERDLKIAAATIRALLDNK